MDVPNEIAPMYSTDERCPAMAISIIPSSGTVMLEIILGVARRSICLFILQK